MPFVRPITGSFTGQSPRFFARLWTVPFQILGALAVVWIWPTTAFAADIIKFEVDFFEDNEDGPSNHATIWTTGRKIRIDQMRPGGGASGPSLIYRGDQDVLMSISDQTQSYVQVERRLLNKLEGRVRAGRHTVAKHLKGLPGDQRKGFERLLGVSPEDSETVKNPIVVELAKEDEERNGEVAGFACVGKVMRRGVVVIGKACVAPWERIGMTPSDMEVFRSLANYQRDALQAKQITPLEIVPNQPLDLIVQFDGIPLSFERKIGEERRSFVRVTSVDWVSEEAALFDSPASYTLATGFAAMLSHLTPPSDPLKGGATEIAAAATSRKASASAKAASPPLSEVAPPAAPAPGPAALSTASEKTVKALRPSRTRVLQASGSARRTVGATRDRKAPVRLFPNR